MRWSIPSSAALAFCLLGGQIAAAHSTQARPAIHQRVARSVPSTSHQAPASPVLAPTLTSPLSRRAEAVVPSGTSTALANKLDVTYGMLGALLILTGVPTTASGFDNKRASAFIVGLYSGGIAVSLIILHVLVDSITSPSPAMRGVYFVSSTIAGIIGGIVGVIWCEGARNVAGALGGFWVAVFMLALKDNGLIASLGGRYALIAAFTTLGFVLTLVPRTAQPALIVSTSAFGATAIMLGVDCFTANGLKEFYVYNFGIALFPQLNGYFPKSEGIQIELGALAGIFICRTAWQLRLYAPWLRKAQELKAERDTRTAEELEAGERAKTATDHSRQMWDEKYAPAKLIASVSRYFRRRDSVDSSSMSMEEQEKKDLELTRLPEMDLGGYSSDAPIAFVPVVPFTPVEIVKTPRSDSSKWIAHLASRQVVTSTPPTLDRSISALSLGPFNFGPPPSLSLSSLVIAATGTTPPLGTDTSDKSSVISSGSPGSSSGQSTKLDEGDNDGVPILRSSSFTAIPMEAVRRPESASFPSSPKIMDLSSPSPIPRRAPLNPVYESSLPSSSGSSRPTSPSGAGPSAFPSGSSPLFSSLLYSPLPTSHIPPVTRVSSPPPPPLSHPLTRASSSQLLARMTAGPPRSSSRQSLQSPTGPPRSSSRQSLQQLPPSRSRGSLQQISPSSSMQSIPVRGSAQPATRGGRGSLPPGAMGPKKVDKESWMSY